MSSVSDIIAENLAAVRSDIGTACAVSGRDPADVRLVAVTKYAEWEWVQALAAMHSDFGENRPQQLAERAPLLPDASWHLIGQLQRNKVRTAVAHANLIHSVDSLRLLQRIDRMTAEFGDEAGPAPDVLLQVNVSGEASKSGLTTDEICRNWAEICNSTKCVEIIGLMTMAPAADNSEDVRSVFSALRNLRDDLAITDAAVGRGFRLPHLSMGMSGDFSVAVEEGATLVRIGRRLYSGLTREA